MYIFKILDNNRVIKNRLDNNLIHPSLKNGCLLHIDPELYTKCPPGGFDKLPSLG